MKAHPQQAPLQEHVTRAPAPVSQQTATNVSYKEPGLVFQLLPPRLACSALRGQGKGGEELGKRRGGRDEEGGGVGEPRLPRAPQCGDFYCGAPALRTHARTRGRPASALPDTGRGQGAEAAGCTLRHARTAGLPGCHPPSPDPAP